LYCIVKCFHAARHRWIAGKFSQRVVVQKRRRTPEADQRWSPIITRCDIFVLRTESNWMRFIEWIKKFQLIDWGKVLVGLRGKVVPHVSSLRIGRKRARRIRFDLGNGIALVV